MSSTVYLLTLIVDTYDGTGTSFPFPSPPAPAPGPSLLDDNESKFLDSFFDGVSSDQFTNDFFPTAGDGLDEIGFNWQDLPPTFMGTTSSFGQQPLLSANDLSSMSFPSITQPTNTAMDRAHPSATADVLAAATLLQNSHNRSHNLGHDAVFATQDLSLAMTPHLNNQPTQQMLPYNQPRARPLPLKQEDKFGDTYYAELMLDRKSVV